MAADAPRWRRLRRWWPVAAALAVVGGLVVYLSSAGVEEPAPRPPAPAPRGPTVWTTPVADLRPGDRRWADRLVRWADAYDDVSDSWAAELGFEEGNSYSIPIYDAADATMHVEVRRKTNFPGIFNIERGRTVPWNPDWRPSAGNDGYMIVQDSRTGHEWAFWNVSWWSHQTSANSNRSCINRANLPPPVGDGYDPRTMLCAASAFEVLDPEGRVVDMRSYGGNFPGASGAGWSISPLLVTPEEVASGRIEHALHFFSANTMAGPECPPEQRDAIGERCGGAVAPAGQLEKHAPEDQPLTQQVPEGTRFSVDLTDAEVEAWLDSRGYSGRLRDTARVIVEALRDYGWFLGDSSPNAAFWTFAGAENPQTAKGWRELGIRGTGKDLLAGLVTKENLRVWAPPTMTCADGSRSQWYCWATSGTYER